MNPDPTPIYQLHVQLRDVEPAVWRRIQVYQHVSFTNLHLTLQLAMGWLHSHLHLFTVGETPISERGVLRAIELEGLDADEARLQDYVSEPGSTFTYEYDFGDSWTHELRLEARLPLTPGRRYPFCVDGAGACPPEDVGGPFGYLDFLEAVADPAHPEYESSLEWVGGPFDPHAFDVDATNRRLREGLRLDDFWILPPLAQRPGLTPAAIDHWVLIPPAQQALLLASAYCHHCEDLTQLIDLQGKVTKGDLLLEGRCVTCGRRVVRLVAGP